MQTSEGKIDATESSSTRRDFLAAAATGAGMLLSATATGQAAPPPQPSSAPSCAETVHSADDLRIAILGAGAQGLVLFDSLMRISNIRVVAVCDIWEYSQKRMSTRLVKFGHPNTVYTDYQELLEKEKDLDAVIVATPDFLHAEHAIACLNAGRHVYCEAPMTHTLAGAKRLLRAARNSQRLLQIGHQRRSNPRYIHALNNLVHGKELLGRLTAAHCQWNRRFVDDLGWPKKYEIAPDILRKHGYDTMQQFRNWRNYRAYSGGPAFLRGSHQFDILNWAFGARTRSVYANASANVATDHEWCENLACIMQYDSFHGACTVNGQYSDTCAQGGFFESISGAEASLLISEIPARGNCVFLENRGRNWEFVFNDKLLRPEKPEQVYVSVTPSGFPSEDVRMLPVMLDGPVHQPHLQNFFDAIRGHATLNCPPETGYQAVAVADLVNQSIKKRRPVEKA